MQNQIHFCKNNHNPSDKWTICYHFNWSCVTLTGISNSNEKSAQRRRKYWALVVVRRSQNFRLAADPFPGAREGQNLISWRWPLPSPTDPVWWRSIHTISSYRGYRPTNKHTNRPGRLQYTAQLSAQCNYKRNAGQRCTLLQCHVFKDHTQNVKLNNLFVQRIVNKQRYMQHSLL